MEESANSIPGKGGMVMYFPVSASIITVWGLKEGSWRSCQNDFSGKSKILYWGNAVVKPACVLVNENQNSSKYCFVSFSATCETLNKETFHSNLVQVFICQTWRILTLPTHQQGAFWKASKEQI